MRAGAARVAERAVAVTAAGAVALLVVSAALVIYLLVALLDPERF